ncbi:autotransporter-associated beta strand repeat-containing protein [Phragmitibacter flavus]|nr:autotransporter-associated beta strand repeat-containing protein [Phragmitibacter flavus]
MKTSFHRRRSITVVMSLMALLRPVDAQTFTWDGGGDGNWSDTTKWSSDPFFPNSPEAIVNFSSIINPIAAPTIITLDVPAVIGQLNMGVSGNIALTIAGANALTFNNGVANAVINKASGFNGVDLISTAIVLNNNLTLNNASTGTLTLAGPITESGGSRSISKTGSGTGAVVLSGDNSFTGGVSVSAGVLRVNGPAALNSSAVNDITLSGGTLELRSNGDSTQALENIIFGDNVAVTGNTTILVDRLTGLPGPTFITPLNKNLQFGNFTIGAQTLTVTASNGYGLEFTGDTILTGAATFAVGGGGRGSNVVASTTLAGVVDDDAGNFGLTKSGNGTLVLANTANTFGDNNIITVSGGILQANGEGSLGHLGNSINLTANSLTQGLRFNYSGTTNRTIRSNAASVGLDVTDGNTITLANALDFSAAGNNLGKNDAGRLILADAAPTIAGAAGIWNGNLTISQGAVQVSGQAALGSTTGVTTASGTAASLEFNNAGVITENINITNGNQTNRGLNGLGVVRATAGTTTLNGTVALAATLGNNQVSTVLVAGVANGATLNLSGTNAVTFNNNSAADGDNRNFNLHFLAEGTGVGNITSAITNVGTYNRRHSIRFAGDGTWNVTAANFFGGTAGATTAATTNVFVTSGTLRLSGLGTFAAPAAADVLAGRIDVSANARLVLDDSDSDQNRLNTRTLRLLGGGDLYYVGGNSANTSENLGQSAAFNLDRGASIINIDASDTHSATLNTGTVGAVSRSNLATLTITGDNIGSAAAAGVGVIVGGNAAGGFSYSGQTGATGTTNKSIMPWILVQNSSLPGGVAFGTSNSAAAATTTGTNVVRGLAANESATTLVSIGSVGHVANVNPNVTLATDATATGQFLINSLRLDAGADVTLGGQGSTLTLESGGLLITGAGTEISNGFLSTSSNRDLIVHALGDTTISANIVGTSGGLTKTGTGTLTLSGQNSYTGETSIQAGTLILDGGKDTLYFGQNLFIGPAATVDLNGNNQYVALLLTQGSEFFGYSGEYATVTNTSATAATLTMGTAAVNYDGVITGNITVARGQNNASYSDWNLYRDNTHTGPTILTGGRTQLIDDAKFSATSRIDIQNATLLIQNGGTYGRPDTDKINDTADINLTAGMFQYRNTQGSSTTEVVGNLTIGAGMSVIDAGETGGGINTAHIQFASLTQAAGQHGTVRFDGGQINGTIGNASNVYFATAPTLSNNLIGGWAMFDRDFASYTGTGGVGRLSSAGYAGYHRTNYSNATINGINSAQAGENIQMLGTGATAAGHSVTLAADTTLNALSYQAANTAGTAVFDLGGNTLTVQSGGLSLSPSASSDTPVSLNVTNGLLTAGAAGVGGDLYIHHLPFQGTDNTERRSINLGATITDNAGGAVALVLNSQNHNGGAARRSTLYITGDNEHTGGTWVNSGRIVLNTAGANGTTITALPGDLTITGGIQQNTSSFDGTNMSQLGEVFSYSSGQIANTSNVTLNGTARLDFTGTPAGIAASPNTVIAQTVASLNFNNTGGQSPTVMLGNGDLTINGNINAASTSVGTNTISNISRTGTGRIDFAGATRDINVSAVTVNGIAVQELLSSLNINAPITNAAGINKTGNGLLMLSAQSDFTGDFNLQQGGILLNASSTPSTFLSQVITGPLGAGNLNVSSGTYIAANTASTIANNLNVLGGDLNFKGIQNITFNNGTTFNNATTTVTVEEFNMTATLNGPLTTPAAMALVKNGNGTLVLSTINTFTGGITLNSGTLIGQTPTSAASSGSPFGSGDITYNGGVLSLRSASSDAVFGNDIIVNPSLGFVNLDVQGGNMITMGTLNIAMAPNPQVTQINVSGTINSILKFQDETLGSNSLPASTARTAGQFQTFNIATGVTTILMDSYARNNEPLNIGQGSLFLGGANTFANGTTISTSGQGAAPTANAATAIYGAGQTVTLSGGTTGTPITYSIMPQTNNVAGVIPGNVTGGLQQSATNVASGSLNIASVWGLGATSIYNGVNPNDASFDRVPHTNASISTLGVYNGYLDITTAGIYEFLLGSDDFSSLVIDGVEVGRDIFSGHGVQDTARGSIFLSAGQHAITFKFNTGTGTPGGGGRLLYSGADTAGNGTFNNWQAIDPSRLSYFTGPASVANNYYNAAQIDNDYVLNPSSVFTLQGLGSDYNSTVKTLSMGAGSQLNITNDLGTAGVGGTGFLGVLGVTTINGANAIINPSSGHFNLIGGINDNNFGLTKTGIGALSLNNSSAFTGTFNINAGTVVLRETNALSTGSNIVASGASVDLYGVGSSIGRNLTINGIGTASQIGAIYNSQATTATFAGNVSLASSSQVAGYGDIILSGTVNAAAGSTFTKAGANTLTLTGNNTATMLGPVAVTRGILNNGLLNSGTTGALGSGSITISANAALNLSGNNLAQNLTLNGTSISNTGPNANTLGNLINSSISNSVAFRNLVTPGSNMLQLANTANTATVSGNITLSTATSGIGSNTFSSGGDIIITGNVGGNQALTKVGGNTVYLRGTNNYTGGTNVNWGSLVLDGAGVLSGAGGRVQVDEGATFTIDNSTTFTNNRINNGVTGNNKNLILRGGTVNIIGNATNTNDVTETFSASVTGGTTAGINVEQGHSNLNLNVTGLTGGSVTLTATRGSGGSDLSNANAGTILIKGANLGLNAVGTDGSTNLLLSNAGSAGAALAMFGQNTNVVAGGANGIKNKGLAAYALVDNGANVDFATLDSTGLGVRAIAANERETANTWVNNSNVLFTSAANATVNTVHSVNSIKLTGGSINLLQGSNLNVQSGGILATASSSINGPGIIGAEGAGNNSTTGAAQNLYFWTHGASTTLTINASIGSMQSNTGRVNEMIKAGEGTLVLGGSNFTLTNTRIQEGTLQINNASAIYYRMTNPAGASLFNGSNTGPTLQVNGTGILDLNGHALTVNNFSSIAPAGNQGSLAGGTVINSVAGTQTLSINATTSNTWYGNISSGTGTINFNRFGRDTFTIGNSNTYTGTTTIGGGATTMVDLGALRGTSSVSINQAALIWNDNGSQSDSFRLGVTPANIIMNGGGFQYNGRLGESSVANLGNVTLNSGASQFTTNAATLGSATTQITSLTRNVGATVNFAGSVLGDDGNVKVTGTAPTNYNGIVGGWAVTNTGNPYNGRSSTIQGGDFVMYDPVSGFRAIVDYQTTGGITFANAANSGNRPAFGNAAFAANNNVRVNNNTTLAAGNNIANSFSIGIDNAALTLSFANPADTLYVQSGGILGSTANQAKTIGASVAAGGKITAGNLDGSSGLGNAANELFIHNLSNVITINAQIVDNAASAVNLVTSTGSQNGPVIRLNNTNTYTGTTTINSTDLRLNSAVGPAIANSLNITVNGGTENAGDSGRQANGRIFFEQNDQLNNAATLNLHSGIAGLDLNNFSQTLANLNFQNIGGHTGNSNGVGPTVRTGTGILTLAGNISATNISNTSTIANISGNLALTAGQHTVNVTANTNAAAQIGLAVNGEISGPGGIDKTGDGVFALTGISTYTGATNITEGTLVLGGLREDASDNNAVIASSRFNISSAATVDMRGGNAIIGSLAGAGTVTNSVYAINSNGNNGNPAVLTLGADNSSTANFSGRFTNFINGVNELSGFNLNVTKIGSGTQTISGDNAAAIASLTSAGDINNVGTLDIQEGTIKVDGANGSLGFATINIKQGAALTLDNSTDNKTNRLGGYRLTDSANGPGDIANDVATLRVINMQGGTINFIEGDTLINEGIGSAALSLATNPGVGTVNLNSGASTWNFDDTLGNGGATITLNSLGAGGGSLYVNVGSNQTLGRTLAGTDSINIYINNGMTSQGTGTLQATGTAVASAAGVSGNIVGGIRADFTATDSTGTGFVTYDRYGYRLLAATEYSAFPVQPNSPLTTGAAATPTNPPASWAAVSPTLSATYTGNALVTEAQTFTTTTTINSLRLDDGGGITSAGGSAIPGNNPAVQSYNALGNFNILTISSGAIVANAGNTGLNGGAISAAGATLRFTTPDAATLISNSHLISTNVSAALVKEGPGTLVLNKNVFMGSNTDSGQAIINGGTLSLNAGHNTLTAVSSASAAIVDFFTVNQGGTVQLNGFDQAIGGLVSSDPTPGSGGIINSGTSANLFVTNSDNATSTFGGSITGAINLYVSKLTGGNAANQILTSTNSYTGTTNLNGSNLTLRDDGALTGTSAIFINLAQLTLENTNFSASQDRLNNSASVNFRGGILSVVGRPGEAVTEDIGAVNLLVGNNTIAVGSGGTSAPTTLNTGAFTRSAGAVVNFSSNSSGTLGGVNAANQGANPRIFIAGQSTGVMGSWAIANGSNFAYYDPILGVGELSNTGAGFPNYESTNYATATALQTVNDGTTRTISTATHAVGLWRIAPNAANTATFGTASGAGTALTITNGGVITNNNNSFIFTEAATQTSRSTITSGSSDLNFFINQNTTTLGLQVVGNIDLIKSGGGTLTLNQRASNTFTGTTYVTAGVLNLSAGAGIVTIPGPLVINNATVTMNTNAGQIAATSDVSLIGSSTLTFVGAANTINRLNFNNVGGRTNPVVNSAANASSILNIGSGLITAIGDSPTTVSTIASPSGGTLTLNFGTTAPELNITTNLPNKVTTDLLISAVIANSASGWVNLAGGGAALRKTGNGNLALSAANTFDTGVSLEEGTITVGNNAALGTGTLTVGNGTTILADSTARTITNNVVVNGDFTFGGQQAGNNLTINGAVNLGAIDRIISVSSPNVTATLAGIVSGGGGLAKSGNGVLVLSNANTYSGGTIINAGLVRAGNGSALGANTNDLTVKANAALNLNGNSLTVDGLNGDDATNGGLITNSGAAATLTVGNNSETSATFAGTITNAANALNLVKTGSGTQILTGTNTYTGTTIINGGVLQVGTDATGNRSTLGSGAVTVNNGGTLAGTGHVLAPLAGNTMTIATGGIIAPGDTAGAGNGNLTLGTIAGSGLDPLAVTTGAVSPSSTAGVVNLTVASGGQISLGVTSATHKSGGFVDAYNLGTTPDALSYFNTLSVTEQQRWNGQAWTQTGTGLVGSNSVTLANLGLGITGSGTGNGGLFVGQSVSGEGIGGGTTITGIDTTTNTITLSNSLQASTTALNIGSTTQNVTLVEGFNSITLADVTGLNVGDTVSGYGIVSGSVIASINPMTRAITLKDATSGSATTPFASTYAPTLSFNAPGNHDHITITGTLSLGSGTAGGVVTIIDNGYLANAGGGDIFNLLDWATLITSGTFNPGTNFRNGGLGDGDLMLPTLSNIDWVWDVSAFTTHGILVVIPEPGRMMLLLIGLGAVVLRRRR